jgi:hypothetical protein
MRSGLLRTPWWVETTSTSEQIKFSSLQRSPKRKMTMTIFVLAAEEDVKAKDVVQHKNIIASLKLWCNCVEVHWSIKNLFWLFVLQRLDSIIITIMYCLLRIIVAVIATATIFRQHWTGPLKIKWRCYFKYLTTTGTTTTTTQTCFLQRSEQRYKTNNNTRYNWFY